MHTAHYERLCRCKTVVILIVFANIYDRYLERHVKQMCGCMETLYNPSSD